MWDLDFVDGILWKAYGENSVSTANKGGEGAISRPHMTDGRKREGGGCGLRSKRT